MNIHIPEDELIALLGENGENWVQGSWGDGNAMCLHGAIRRCAPVKGDAFLIEQVAARKGWGTDWNDANDTTWADVRARLSQVEITDDDLAATFGPQWETIVVLVRRAAVLTADEANQFVAAWVVASDAARAAAWAAARAAARDAAWAAARAAARDAAWDAAWAAARAAARDAAQALVVRDLIGQHGFTQAHYDMLTGPWATVMGSAHPDDEAL